MKNKSIKLAFLLTVFTMLGCSQETSSASADGQDIQSTAVGPESALPREIVRFVDDLNENLSDMSSFDKGSYMQAAAIQDKDGQFVLTINGILLTDDAGSDESEKWSVSSNDLMIGLITIEASKSKLFSHIKWIMNVNEFRIEGSRTFPHDPDSDYQKVVAIR